MTERKDLVLSIEAQETTDKKVAQSDQILPETNAGIGDPGSSLQSTFSSGELIAGRFKIIRFIARGGMGEVYEAEDLELRERVALKTIRSKVEQNKKAMEHFRREIQIARKVTHPNVCRTFDLFHHKSGEIDITFLTMELLRGESLTARLGRSGKMTTVEAFPIVQQMADALTAAHKAGIIHRDFKSPNVVLVPIQGNEEEVRVVVTDFGLARAIESNESEALTSTGAIVGTPAYMAPEQVEGGEVTAAADIYALGIVMYEMLTGTLPFTGDSPISMALKRLMEAPVSPRAHVRDLDSKWEAAVLRCLERNPADRFTSAAEVVKVLTGEQVPVSRRIPEARRERQEIVSSGAPSVRRWVWIPVLLGIVAVAVGSLLLFRKLHEDTRKLGELAQISHWNKVMYDAVLSSDGHAFAFTSYDDFGTKQVFVMLTTGGDPLQVTHDEEDKDVYRFSPDGTEVYYARSVGAPEVWAVPVLGGTPHRLFTGDPGIPSLDGQFIYRVDEKGHAILRSDRTGMRDDVIYRDEKVDVGLGLVYPDGKSLLMGKWWSPFSVGHFFKLDLTTKTALALGTVSERQGHLLY